MASLIEVEYRKTRHSGSLYVPYRRGWSLNALMWSETPPSVKEGVEEKARAGIKPNILHILV